MKIGILTYFMDVPLFNDLNPGMNLQAYSVYLLLKDRYPNAQIEIIRYHYWRAWWHPYFHGLTIKSLLMDFKMFYKTWKFSKRFPKSDKSMISNNYAEATAFINALGYDAIYVGSDTLLELIRAPYDGITPYWLSPKVTSKKYMIAASARGTSFSDLSEKQKNLLERSISGFKKMGVRDDATYNLISNFIKEDNQRLKIIPDPTFYLDIDYSFSENYAKSKGLLSCGKPVICIHTTRNNCWTDSLVEIFHKNGYLIASIRPLKNIDFLLKDMSPLEFAGVFKFFKLVITHRFHDSVFSIKNLTPVVNYVPNDAYKNKQGDSKQSSLLDSFGLKETNYIDDINSLSPDLIFRKVMTGCDAFHAKINTIENQLKANRNVLTDYVKEISLDY